MVIAVPAPVTRAAGSRVTSGIWQADITDPVTFLTNPPVFQGYQTAVQSIGNSSFVPLALDTEAVDSYTGHSTVTNNSRWTCPAGGAGWYLVIGYFGCAANGTGVRLTRINKNGATLPLSQSDLPTPGAAVTLAGMAIALVQLAVGDYVETCGFQTSGGALNTVPGDSGMVVLFYHA
ncbi:hypothetical protein [Streptomyces sp. NRRL B-24484]|uniref:hypothetical protein n=1 Tax=Streptomyces sp. NRRL B-24484 TaxID=1463833 RepID=UPI000694A007|nr:hypothetical protein [Streptomyces sp. NRRL B-24484]